MFRSLSNSIRHHTRGGQLFFHRLYMSLQIHLRTFMVIILGALVCLGVAITHNDDPYRRGLYLAHVKAQLFVSIKHGDQRVSMKTPLGRTTHMRAQDLVRSQFVQKEIDTWYDWFKQQAMIALVSAVGIACLIAIFFYVSGRAYMRKQYLSGNTQLGVKPLARQLKKSGQASDLVIEGLPLVKNSETQHIGLVGTTGVGKSVLIKKLIRYARTHNQSGVIYDKTGELTAEFFDPTRGDKLLNPFDTRMPVWDIWSDCVSAPDFDAMAANIIAPTKGDPFWSDGARMILGTLLREYGHQTTQPTLPEFLSLLYGDLSKNRLLKDTEAAQLINAAAEKTLASFANVLAVNTRSLRYLPTQGAHFSIRDWVGTQRGLLFLTSRHDIHESLKPLMTSWINTVINALMGLPPSADRRFWYFLDEFPSLNRIPNIETLLAEGRKYGACVVLGLQAIAQLEAIYGHANAQTITSLLNTSFIFRQSATSMAEWASKQLGESRYLEASEGVSYGANTVRDGVSVNKHEKIRRVATPADVLSLPNLTCYARLAGNYPVTKLTLSIENAPVICEPYMFNLRDLNDDNDGKTKRSSEGVDDTLISHDDTEPFIRF